MDDRNRCLAIFDFSILDLQSSTLDPFFIPLFSTSADRARRAARRRAG